MLPLNKQFLALHFCRPEFRSEWLRLEFAYHDSDTFDFYRMRGLLIIHASSKPIAANQNYGLTHERGNYEREHTASFNALDVARTT